jgi:endonuclease/exonuclease/phosphatase (EEP) superfamily protein YafD
VSAEAPSAARRPRLRFNRQRVADTALLLSGLLALSTFLAFFADSWWAFDLFSHFRVQYSVAALFLAVALWSLRRRMPAVLVLVVAAVNLWFVAPHLVGVAQATTTAGESANPVRVLSVNVFGFNEDFERVLRYVRAENPDVLIVLEVTPEWADAIRKLSPDYAYEWIHPGDLRSGIAVLSRDVPSTASELDLGGTGEPSLILTLHTAEGPLSILGTHLYWPLGERVSAVRNRQMRTLAQIARTHAGPLVIAGDLNVTPFSPHFTQLLRDGRLRNCAPGLQPTWPARLPFLFITIDHCLASEGVRVDDFRVGEYVGSDHYPIVMDVAVTRR